MPVLNTVIGNCPSEHVLTPESAPTSAAARPAARRSMGVVLAGVAALLSVCLSGATRHAAGDASASKTAAAVRPSTRPAQSETVINVDFGWDSLLARRAAATGTSDSAEPAAFSIAAAPVPAPAASGELLHEAASVTLTEGAGKAVAPRPVVETKLRKTRTIRMQVTAYCACKKCCGRSARGLTASGRHVSYNGGAFVAADTDLLPFGTRLVIPGYHNGKPVEVIDRGGAIKGHHIDVFFPSHEQAIEWGNQWLDVTVVE